MIGLRLGQEAACQTTVTCRALRLAAILCHARRDPDLKGFTLKVAEDNRSGFVIQCKKAWLQKDQVHRSRRCA